MRRTAARFELLWAGSQNNICANDHQLIILQILYICPTIEKCIEDDKYKIMENEEWVVELEYEDVKKIFDPVIEKMNNNLKQAIIFW
jgi:hypothetical protein